MVRVVYAMTSSSSYTVYLLAHNGFHLYMYIVFVDIVAAVPRYDDDTYSGRITVYNPPDYQTIQNVEARGTQVACSS